MKIEKSAIGGWSLIFCGYVVKKKRGRSHRCGGNALEGIGKWECFLKLDVASYDAVELGDVGYSLHDFARAVDDIGERELSHVVGREVA